MFNNRPILASRSANSVWTSAGKGSGSSGSRDTFPREGFSIVLCARKLAAAEQAVLVILCRGLAYRGDLGNLGQRLHDRGAFGDCLEPARDIRIVGVLDAIGLAVARPRECRNVGNRIFLAAKIRRFTKAL